MPSASDAEADWVDVEQEMLSASDTEAGWADVEREMPSASDAEADWADVEQEIPTVVWERRSIRKFSCNLYIHERVHCSIVHGN